MARIPVDLLPMCESVDAALARASDIANRVQREFIFEQCTDQAFTDWIPHAVANKIHTVQFLDSLGRRRDLSRGYHPFVMTFTDAYLVGRKLSNLFADNRPASGLSIVTIHQVPEILGKNPDSIVGYLLYYLARYSMSFVSPQKRGHNETRQCIFDRKIAKRDIIQSMRAGAICGECRNSIWESGKGTRLQMDAIDRMLDHASSLVHKTRVQRRPTVFVGSSSKHLEHARIFKRLLGDDFLVHVWDEDEVFRIGTATIEQLEQHVTYYDFGIFLMFPDDKIERDQRAFMGPRDNVVFEAGLFTGKLTRDRAIVLTTLHTQVTLPSDLHGLTTLQIDYDAPALQALDKPAKRASAHMKRIFEKGAP